MNRIIKYLWCNEMFWNVQLCNAKAESTIPTINWTEGAKYTPKYQWLQIAIMCICVCVWMYYWWVGREGWERGSGEVAEIVDCFECVGDKGRYKVWPAIWDTPKPTCFSIWVSNVYVCVGGGGIHRHTHM